MLSLVKLKWGTIRFFDPDQEEYYVESIRRVVEHTAEAYGANCYIRICKKYRLPLMILHLVNWRNVSLLIH